MNKISNRSPLFDKYNTARAETFHVARQLYTDNRISEQIYNKLKNGKFDLEETSLLLGFFVSNRTTVEVSKVRSKLAAEGQVLHEYKSTIANLRRWLNRQEEDPLKPDISSGIEKVTNSVKQARFDFEPAMREAFQQGYINGREYKGLISTVATADEITARVALLEKISKAGFRIGNKTDASKPAEATKLADTQKTDAEQQATAKKLVDMYKTATTHMDETPAQALIKQLQSELDEIKQTIGN